MQEPKRKPVKDDYPTEAFEVETFDFMMWRFHVRDIIDLMAKGKVDFKIIEADVSKGVHGFKKELGWDGHSVHSVIKVEAERAQELTLEDLDVPGIMVELSEEKNTLLIDGNHRAVRSHMEGRSTFPVRLIPFKEMKRLKRRRLICS